MPVPVPGRTWPETQDEITVPVIWPTSSPTYWSESPLVLTLASATPRLRTVPLTVLNRPA